MVDKLNDIQGDTWAISNELIDRLNLKPAAIDPEGLYLKGEDGGVYSGSKVLGEG